MVTRTLSLLLHLANLVHHHLHLATIPISMPQAMDKAIKVMGLVQDRAIEVEAIVNQCPRCHLATR